MREGLPHVLARLVLRRVENIEGLENVPTHGPALLVPNHISYFDPVMLFATLFQRVKRSVHFMAFQGHWWFPGAYDLARWSGTQFISGRKPGTILDKFQRLLAQGELCVVYPEGSRNPHEHLLKAKTGAARLALWTRVPVIPVGITGPATRSVVRAWIYFFQKKPFRITFGHALDLTEFHDIPVSYDILRAVTRKMMYAISELCGKRYHF
ncbi:MAG: hypothetical protein A2898_00935 [Candidatus Kerfeldbacteria bacterium RIFCSPLOWO2_01_FULL_48_11]|uniref:Phospholipid/glycerol acyltransferase domain-containing protein n=1 Tax=Candidatus Kerfeldbacteria bacterium RIFCSPLOWO2_01_FULL_48_11 TaxID=1798543 RepID=A0A1G2B7H4_9BACT|nr:MAG: 1-acyl-sn-glycerol-3-phosphate acyltransferase [Parcubacteria group bacterium GW2011_GWA2_48_9]KKW16101.1 MAG: 1-acyl-sn-glycerol-3-phosphate acyltransferase [Parcubacteria group bacterium GW2011_GWC2_49_9]OGY84656.1 MAG: hypothetical protein A2898_00935 [Candidatus Kerfeldbacteria bacterium RIFCSPLOWO2_01_FULL_48_11]HCJ52542.1 hypothetical protein [Candidatus Kerfeldbacteria bacterium]HCM68777.1 hypothetical protein [Candidatus Kerfeldbacteria bacterium]